MCVCAWHASCLPPSSPFATAPAMPACSVPFEPVPLFCGITPTPCLPLPHPILVILFPQQWLLLFENFHALCPTLPGLYVGLLRPSPWVGWHFASGLTALISISLLSTHTPLSIWETEHEKLIFIFFLFLLYSPFVRELVLMNLIRIGFGLWDRMDRGGSLLC